jgi:membrane-associated phospholipid phosphatase
MSSPPDYDVGRRRFRPQVGYARIDRFLVFRGMTSRPLSFSTPAIRLSLTIAAALALFALAALPTRENLYRAIAGTAADSNTLGGLAGAVASRGLLLLVALAALIALWAWLRDRTAFWRLAAGGIGVVGAYLLSEAIKLIVTEERPCRALDVATVKPCPEVGDWSWPSNHAVIAAAFATACIIALPRTAWFAAPIAVLIAFSRVAAGVHYIHDVASGLALGTAVVALVAVALQRAVSRLPESLATSNPVAHRRP